MKYITLISNSTNSSTDEKTQNQNIKTQRFSSKPSKFWKLNKGRLFLFSCTYQEVITCGFGG